MTCQVHQPHDHVHGRGCGHVAVEHEGHIDYLHAGHLHHVHDDHVDEHAFAESPENPSTCTPTVCFSGHVHGPDCGHAQVPHGDHVDFLVNGRLHHVHGDHCDDHGPIQVRP